MVDDCLVLLCLGLIHLEDIPVHQHLMAVDGEGNEHPDVMFGCKISQRLHHFGI